MTTRSLPTLLDVPDARRRPMTRKETEIFVSCCWLDAKPEFAPIEAEALGRFTADELPQPTPAALSILVGRLRGRSGRYAPAVALFLAGLADRPARAVMWAHYLVRRTREAGPVDMGLLARDFPTGFPVDDAYVDIWGAQKRRAGDPDGTPENALDAAWAWADASPAEIEVAHG